MGMLMTFALVFGGFIAGVAVTVFLWMCIGESEEGIVESDFRASLHRDMPPRAPDRAAPDIMMAQGRGASDAAPSLSAELLRSGHHLAGPSSSLAGRSSGADRTGPLR